MRIVIGHPPNIEKIKARFNINPDDKIVFTYGDTIFNPGAGHIDYPLQIHESTHMKQQGDDPEGWWNKYMEDDKFRLEQEIEAYRAQYKTFLGLTKDRQAIFKFVDRIAKDLSGHIYGHIINYFDAVMRIKK